MSPKISFKLPKEIMIVSETLEKEGFDSYLVGGCVRDLFLDRKPKDWDFTTNAKPEDLTRIFEHTIYENNFGTVLVVFDDAKEESLKTVEITPYRKESEYTDSRRPAKVEFGVSLEADLARRDFTINTLAYNPNTSELIDLHNGIKDLNKGIIKTVGDPELRFKEDALRLMRAIRIATQLGGEIEEETLKSIQRNAERINNIAIERIRDEFLKIILTDTPMQGILLLEKTGLLEHIVPELREGISIEQNQAHKYDVFEHNLRTLQHAGVKDLSLKLRLSALFHDISKPATREWSEEKKDWTFYNHEVVGARVTRKVMKRLKFPNELIEDVSLFVRWHMFFSDTEKVSLTGVRRMVARIGNKQIWDLIDLRMCDRIGTGRPKEQPYRLRKYKSLVEEVLRDSITPGMLDIDGKTLMLELKEKPGPKLGSILNTMLSEVLDDKIKNNKEDLIQRAKILIKLSDEELKKLGEKGKVRRFEEEEKEIKEIRSKNFVD